jgi:recombination protein RecT
VPKSPELAMALAMDEINERGETQNLGIAEAIDGSWAPVLDEQPDDAGQASGDPLRASTRKPLGDLLASIGQALSIEALDEIYAQAEDFVAGDDLEQLLRAYRSRKAALTPSPQLSPSSPIRGVVNSPSV